MASPTFFRKKPVVVAAMLYDGSEESAKAIGDWMAQYGHPGIVVDGDGLKIETLEGTMTANPGDRVIRGVKGEFYPCKPDIFDQTYELAA